MRSSASFLKYSAALPFGVSVATTWLNFDDDFASGVRHHRRQTQGSAHQHSGKFQFHLDFSSTYCLTFTDTEAVRARTIGKLKTPRHWGFRIRVNPNIKCHGGGPLFFSRTRPLTEPLALLCDLVVLLCTACGHA